MAKKRKEQNELFENMNEIRTKLFCMRNYYNELTDQNLISSCIYEINALEAKYSHLITMAKSEGVTGDVVIYPTFNGKI